MQALMESPDRGQVLRAAPDCIVKAVALSFEAGLPHVPAPGENSNQAPSSPRA